MTGQDTNSENRQRKADALRAAVTITRPWQDVAAMTEAFAPAMGDGPAGLVAEAMPVAIAQLGPPVGDAAAVAVAATLYRNVMDRQDALSHGASTARELIRFGVPDGTAYDLAAKGMRPDEALPYAMRRVARLLDTDHRMREGVRRATARKGAARRFPRPQP